MRFQATDLLGFFGIWGFGVSGQDLLGSQWRVSGQDLWAHSGGFRVWGFRVEIFWGFFGSLLSFDWRYGVWGFRLQIFCVFFLWDLGFRVQGQDLIWG